MLYLIVRRGTVSTIQTGEVTWSPSLSAHPPLLQECDHVWWQDRSDQDYWARWGRMGGRPRSAPHNATGTSASWLRTKTFLWLSMEEEGARTSGRMEATRVPSNIRSARPTTCRRPGWSYHPNVGTARAVLRWVAARYCSSPH